VGKEGAVRKILWNLFSEDKDNKKLCLRRIVGTIGFLVCVFALFHPDVKSGDFQILTYVSAGLIGSTTVDCWRGQKSKGGEDHEEL
jgi:hypothetical protein